MNDWPQTISFWRGRLPHWEVVDGKYFVTIHLAGAVPKAAYDRIDALVNDLDAPTESGAKNFFAVQRLIFREIQGWLDRAEPVAFLSQQDVAEMVLEAIQFRNGNVWNVFEYVIMPNHIHLFFEILKGGLKSTLEDFKRWTGHQAMKLLGAHGRRFWQVEWFDHWSRSDAESQRIIQYMRENPEKAGLVENYLDWAYGSWSLSGCSGAPLVKPIELRQLQSAFPKCKRPK